jgi:hypothetical protein
VSETEAKEFRFGNVVKVLHPTGMITYRKPTIGT